MSPADLNIQMPVRLIVHVLPLLLPEPKQRRRAPLLELQRVHARSAVSQDEVQKPETTARHQKWELGSLMPCLFVVTLEYRVVQDSRFLAHHAGPKQEQAISLVLRTQVAGQDSLHLVQ